MNAACGKRTEVRENKILIRRSEGKLKFERSDLIESIVFRCILEKRKDRKMWNAFFGVWIGFHLMDLGVTYRIGNSGRPVDSISFS